MYSVKNMSLAIKRVSPFGRPGCSRLEATRRCRGVAEASLPSPALPGARRLFKAFLSACFWAGLSVVSLYGHAGDRAVSLEVSSDSSGLVVSMTPKEGLDFGVVHWGERKKAEIRVTEKSGKKLLVSGWRSPCDCLTISGAVEEIGPGQTARATVELNGDNYLGRFEKHLFFRFAREGDDEGKDFFLPIRYTVIEGMPSEEGSSLKLPFQDFSSAFGVRGAADSERLQKVQEGELGEVASRQAVNRGSEASAASSLRLVASRREQPGRPKGEMNLIEGKRKTPERDAPDTSAEPKRGRFGHFHGVADATDKKEDSRLRGRRFPLM